MDVSHTMRVIGRRGVLTADDAKNYPDQNNLMTMTNVCYMLF